MPKEFTVFFTASGHIKVSGPDIETRDQAMQTVRETLRRIVKRRHDIDLTQITIIDAVENKPKN